MRWRILPDGRARPFTHRDIIEEFQVNADVARVYLALARKAIAAARQTVDQARRTRSLSAMLRARRKVQ